VRFFAAILLPTLLAQMKLRLAFTRLTPSVFDRVARLDWLSWLIAFQRCRGAADSGRCANRLRSLVVSGWFTSNFGQVRRKDLRRDSHGASSGLQINMMIYRQFLPEVKPFLESSSQELTAMSVDGAKKSSPE